MLHLEKNQYPKDFYYHRTASATYREYLHTCKLTTFDIKNPPQYAWKKPFFWGKFWVIKYERIDVEPDIEYLKKITGFQHAFVVWIPYSQENVGSPWRRLWLTDHFEETGYAELDHRSQITDSRLGNKNQAISHPPVTTPTYLSSWNDRAKRARKKFLASGCTIRDVTPEEFIEGFRITKVKHWYKSAYISYYKRMVGIDATKIRQWLIYDPIGKVISWLAVHDFCENHSVHLVAFTDQKGYHYQPGTGLIDRWFSESYERGYKYLSFDQLRNKNGPKDQKWYTEFKESFLSARLSFKKAFFRFF